MYVGTGTSLTIESSSFANSKSITGSGGSIFAAALSKVTLASTTIQSSSAALYGGGVGVQDSGSFVLTSLSSIYGSDSQCCFWNEKPYFTSSVYYSCSDVNYGGTSMYDCCLPEQYWSGSSCVPCDFQTMLCSSVGTSIGTVSLRQGYWRATNYTTDIRECWNPDACVGGHGTADFSSDSQYCAVGYVGPYCAVCDSDYFNGPGRTCSQCASSLSTGMIVWCIFLVVLFLCAIAAITVYLVMDQDNPAVFEERSRFLSTLKRWITKFGKLNWGRLRIPIVAAQIVSQGVEVTGLTLPSVYETFLGWASFANLDINMLPSLDCMVSTNFYDRLRFVTIVPLCAVLYLCLTYRIVVWRARNGAAVSSPALTNGDGLRASPLEEAKLKHFRAFLVLTFLVYSTVSSTIFQTFAWDDVLSDPESTDSTNYTYLRVDYSVNANTTEHTNYMIYAGVMIFVYPLGIPALYTYLLWLSRAHFSNLSIVTDASQPVEEVEIAPSSSLRFAEEVSQEEPEVMVAKPKNVDVVSGQDLVDSARFLWGAYVPLFFYWEILECFRRILQTGIIVFLFPGTAAQISISCIFALVSIVVIAIYRPHADRFDFMLYMSGSVLVFLTMYLGLNMKVDVGNETAQSQAAFSALLITLHLGMTVAAFVNMWIVAKATYDSRSMSLSSAVNLNA